jgi:hypothetical protein
MTLPLPGPNTGLGCRFLPCRRQATSAFHLLDNLVTDRPAREQWLLQPSYVQSHPAELSYLCSFHLGF